MSLLLLLLLLALPAFAADAPAWAKSLAKQPVPAYAKDVQVVVLLNEEQLVVAPDGRRTMRVRGARRILQPGVRRITASRSYDTRSGKIKSFRGWSISPDGKETEYGKDRILDVGLSETFSYEESRSRILEFDANSAPGTVFAYEIVEEEETIFTTTGFGFQSMAPVLVSRYILTLPPGWESKAQLVNHPPLEPAVQGDTQTWELQNLPPVPDEEDRPPLGEITPSLAITYFPSESAIPALKPLRNWASVSAWLSQFVEKAAEVTEPVRSKAVQLTGNAGSETGKIEAIARYVQQVNYVSVQMNLTKGGGYTPNKAQDVLTRNYGDCKDKTSLMRSLLKAVGIDSYMTVIYSGYRRHVKPQWPSSLQFNHAIIAVRVSPPVQLPTALDHPKLGRLLFFDPTDDSTPLGGLPEDEQDSWALVIAGDSGDLVRMPRLPEESTLTRHKAEAVVDAEGAATAQVTSSYPGDLASSWRAMVKTRAEDDVRKVMERRLSNRVGGTTLVSLSWKDHPAENRFDLSSEMNVKQFGRVLQSRLLILVPGALTPDLGYYFAAKERKLPVDLSGGSRQDRVSIRVPQGFAVDELPGPVRIDSPYGAYTASWKHQEDRVLFEQSLQVPDKVVPAAEYDSLRKAFEQISGGRNAAVVLVRR